MLFFFRGNLVKSPGQHGDLTESADRGGIAICECGLRMWDVKYGLPFTVYRLRFDELTNSLID